MNKLGIVATALVLAGLAACSSQSSDASLPPSEVDAWDYRGRSTGTVFLSEHGLGSREEAIAYYEKTIGPSPETSLTLAQWRTQNIGSAPIAHALYRNKTELGFWRDMTCTKTIARGVGGCMVSNYNSPSEVGTGAPTKGTVAMNVSAAGFVQFYVFLPNGKLSPSAVLDDEGPKFLPRMCTVCHSGRASNPAANPDLGSIFREFEPTLLEPRPGVDRATAEQEWSDLNLAVRGANEAIRAQSEGASSGTDRAKRAMIERIDALRAQSGTPDAVPASWNAGGPAARTLFTKLMVPYCLSCHRHNAYDWTNYESFAYLRENGLLKNYLPNAPDPDSPESAMPQSAFTFGLLQNDQAAKSAVSAWLAPSACTPSGNPFRCEPGAIEATTAGCANPGTVRHRTCSDQCLWESFSAECRDEVQVPDTVSGVAAKKIALSTARKARRLEGNCPSVAPFAFAETPFVYVSVRNPTTKRARVAIFTSQAPGGAIIDTVMAAYDGPRIPVTDEERRACSSGVGDVGNESLTGHSDFASLDGNRAVTIAPGAMAQIYVAAFNAQATGPLMISVKTLSLE
jgi:hypothetical protein